LAPQLNVEIVNAVPFVFDIAHDQRMIEFNRALWKFRSVRKITGVDVRNIQRLNLPLRAAGLRHERFDVGDASR